MAHKAQGKGKLAVQLDRVASDGSPPEAPKKSGVETVREKFQADADSEAEDRVRIVDHDANRVLWSGTAAEHRALKKVLGGEG